MNVTFSQYKFLYHFEDCRPTDGNLRAWVSNIYNIGEERGKALTRLFKHIVSSTEVTEDAPVRELAEIICYNLKAHIQRGDLSVRLKEKTLKRIQSFEDLQKNVVLHINQLAENCSRSPLYSLPQDLLHALLESLPSGDAARIGRTCKQGMEVYQKAKELPQSPVLKKLVQKALAEKKYDDLIALFKTTSNNNCQQTSDYPLELEFSQNVDTETLDKLFSFFTNVKKLYFEKGILGSMQKVGQDLFKKILSSLKNLEELGLSSLNRLFTPDQLKILLEQCTKLTRLDLEHESEDGHRAFLQLPSHPPLISLNLAGSLSFSDPELQLVIQKCPHLKELDISNWKVTTEGFQELSKLKFLQSLILRRVRIPHKKTLNIILDSCPNLQELDISYTHSHVGKGWKDKETKLYFSNNLRSLILTNLVITDEDLEDIVQSFPNLEMLDLNECGRISQVGFEKLARLVHLQSAILTSTKINSQALNTIALGCPSIKTLHVIFCSDLEQTTLKQFYSIKQLGHLFLSRILPKNDSILEHIADNFPHLKKLILNGTPLDRASFHLSLGHLKKLHFLTALTLSHFQFADNVLEQIILANPFLEELDLSGSKIRKEEFIALSKARNLKRLNASNTEIDDTSLKEISRSCRKLVELKLENCKQFTHLPFADKGTWPLLEELGITRTAISSNSLKEIQEIHPKLKIAYASPYFSTYE